MTSKDLEKLMAKLEQDNKILAELDKQVKQVTTSSSTQSEIPRMSTSLPSLTTTQLYRSFLTSGTANALTKPSLFSYNGAKEFQPYQQTKDELKLDEAAESQEVPSRSRKVQIASHNYDSYKESPEENLETELSLTACEFGDAKRKAVLTKQRSVESSAKSLTSKDLDKLMAKLEQDNKILAELDKKVKQVSSNIGSTQSLIPRMSSSLPSLTTTHLYRYSLTSGTSANALTKPGLFPYNGTKELQPYQQQKDELKLAEEIVDSLEIPGRGRCKVYIARYSYDPYKQSPNENPEAEISLAAGDFVLIFGDMDEDGFFQGELLDGHRGLVPSNFVEKLTGEDLFEFQASVLYNRDAESESSYPPEFYDVLLNDTMCHTNFQPLLAPEDFHRINDYIDLEDITEIDEDVSDLERAEQDAARVTVPPPQRLVLERQLHKSTLIGWMHPDCPRGTIESYAIYVDGVLKATIPSGDRTKALVEGVDSSMPHRISVRAIDRAGHQSRDPACTIVIGKNIPFAPCCVKASSITSESAVISWLPCNSNFYHVVAVNSVEVRTLKPSVYKHLITGLSANTLYRVSVRAKPGKLLCSDEKNPKKLEMLTTYVDFRTLPKSLPDPPVDIQVEQGPQEGTLLVTWLPVTLNQFGTSNNCPVTGYAVFCGHKKMAEIDSPTGDHALLDVTQLESMHRKAITVRTKSGENLSQDSMPCQIPDEYLKCVPHKKMHHSDSESDTELTQLMNNVVRRSKAFDPAQSATATAYDHRTNTAKLATRQITRTTALNRPVQQQPKHPHTTVPTHPQSQLHHPQSQLHQPHHQRQVLSRHRHFEGEENLTDKDLMSRMNIPAIEITKDTPSESINPMESYSEEEFEATMRMGRSRGYGASPVPPHRTRAISDYERSHFGPQDQFSNRRGVNQQMARERGVRLFVALFDYDPLTMSPNPGAADEELPFQEGQVIKIYGDKDPDGFYQGEANGRFGLVPCNMVSEVQYDGDMDPMRQHGPNDPWAHLPVRKMIALYDYDPQELSPNVDAEMELAFNTGDVVYVYGEMDEDGFYAGEVNGVRGLVPSNFLQEAPGDARHGKQVITQGPRSDPRMMAVPQPGMLPLGQQLTQAQIQQLPPNDPRQLALNQQLSTTGQPVQQLSMGQVQPPYTHPQSAVQTRQAGMQQPLQQQQQPQPQQQPFMGMGYNQYQQQPNQAMGRGMRQQGPMGPQQPSTGFNQGTMFQGNVLPGNKQRPATLDLQGTSPKPNILQQGTTQQPQQQTGLLGGLFAGGQKILEAATTPRAGGGSGFGPFAGTQQQQQQQNLQQMMSHPQHPQTGMGAHPAQMQPQQPHPGLGHLPQHGQFGQQQHAYGQQPGQFGPGYGQGPDPQAGGTIFSTMKNIFKL